MPEMSHNDDKREARVLRAWQIPAAAETFMVPEETSIEPVAGGSAPDSPVLRALIVAGWVVAGCLTLYAIVGIFILLGLRL